MNKRLKKMKTNNLIPNQGGVFIDAYNQTINTEIAGTITTRVDASNMTFVTDIIPLNTDKDGNSLCLKANYFKMGGANFVGHTNDGLRATCIMEEIKDTDTTICLNSKVDGKQPSIEHRIYDSRGISTAITTGFYPSIAEVQQVGNIVDDTNRNFKNPQTGRIYSADGLSPTINTCQGGGREPKIIEEPLRIREATIKGYAEAYDGDSINLAVPNSQTRRGRVGNQIANTLDTGCQQGVVSQYRIRKLTPRECFRLMDVNETDIDKLLNSGISNLQLYKMAGNSIVVSCLYHIFRKMFIEKENENQQLTLF